MISNSVTHVKTELQNKLALFFANSYIINVVLSEIEDDVVSSFANKYLDKYEDTPEGKEERIKDGTEIPILTTFPETINNDNYPFIYVGMGDGKEYIDSLGTSMSSYESNNKELTQERCKLTRVDNTTLGATLKNEPDISSVSIPDFSYNKSDISYEDGKLLIKNINPNHLDNIRYDSDTLIISYAPKVGDSHGMSYGFIADEYVSILIISNNMDEIRILDSFIKAAVILMRNDDKEMTKYQLGNVSYSAPAPLEGFAPGEPYAVFGREIVINYKVDYTLDSNNLQRINSITLIR